MKDYANAYSEVLEVLKYIPKEDYDKIPKKTIKLLESNNNEKSQFSYNIANPFDKQGLSKEAKVILAIIYRNCWIKEEEKKQLRLKEKDNFENEEKLKREKYNPDNLFEHDKKSESIGKNSDIDNINALVEIKKETIFGKIIKFCKTLFKIN